MPSIAGHMAVAKLVSKKLKIDDPEFIRGNLLPDIISQNDSHYKIKGQCFLIPDIDYFRNNFDLNNNLYLGYYAHLLLDKYFLEEFVPKNISNFSVFQEGIMYNEYNLINYLVVKEFKLDVDNLRKILKDFSVDICKDKLEYNLHCLSNTKIRETSYLKFQEFSEFIYNISTVISKEIECYAS